MRRWATSWLLAGLLSGCAAGPSKQCVCQPEIASPSPQAVETAGPPPQIAETTSPAAPVQIERGRPNRFLDGTGRILGVPERLLLWNRRVKNHQISLRTEEMVTGYLRENDLPDVLVRVNQYAPLAEWKRLGINRHVGAGWRYTVGAFDLLLYTLIPGRLLGADSYNPFTNTIYLYSDVPAIALHEAAYAKNIHHRRYPGTYAVVQHIPVVGMWYRTNATIDVLQYLKQRSDSPAELQEADRILYPMYGGAAGGQVGQFVPVPFVGTAVHLVGIGVGHVVGRSQAHRDLVEEQEGQLRADEQESGTIVPATATEVAK
jgi:hypothetical protein